MDVCVCICVLVTLIIKLWLRVLHQVHLYSFLPNGEQLKTSNIVIVIIQINEIIYNLVKVFILPSDLTPRRSMWRFKEESGFWREPASLVLHFVFTVFQNFSVPFPSQTPSQGADGTSNGEEITASSLQFAEGGTPVCTEQFTKGPGQYEEMKSVMQCYSIKVSHPMCGQSHRKNQNYVDSPALFLTFHMKLRETHSQPLHRLPVWHCNPWYLSVIHKTRYLDMSSKLQVSICHTVG